ncbi:MAG: polysaccharide biosynthesis C-terminal domain-containing protein [Balneolaceae bacterium]
MGLIVRQSLKNALYTYVGIGLGFVTTIFLYTWILDTDQYGLTRVLISAATIGAQFAHLGMRNTIIRFFPLFRKSEGRGAGLLFLGLVVPLAGFLVFSLLYWLFREPVTGFYLEQSPLFTEFFLYVLPLTLFLLYFEILNSYLCSLHDSTTGSLAFEVVLRVLIILNLGLYFFGWIDFTLFIILFTVAYGVQPLLLLAVLLRRGEFKLSSTSSLFRKRVLRGVSSYGLYTLLGGLTTVVVWNVDILMLGAMAGLEKTAIYAIAFYIGSVITVPQRAIERIATPLVASHLQKKNWSEVADIYKKSSVNQTIAGFYILALIWFNADALFSLIPEVYAEGKWVILIIGAGKLFDMTTGVNGSILITSRYYRFDLVANLLLVLFTVGLNLLLIPKWGIEGAAAATLLSILLYNLIKLIYIHVRLSMQPFGREHLQLLGAAIISAAAAWALPVLPLIPNLALTFTVITVTFLLPVWWFELSPEMNRLAESVTDRWKGG